MQWNKSLYTQKHEFVLLDRFAWKNFSEIVATLRSRVPVCGSIYTYSQDSPMPCQTTFRKYLFDACMHMQFFQS